MSNVVQILVTTFSAFIFLLIFAIPFLLKWLFFDAGTSKKNPPPSPPRLPIIGHLHKLGSHPHRSFLSLARRHGPIMLLRLGNKEAVIVSSADAAREIMKTHDLVFSDRPDFKINRKLLYDLKDISVAPYGKYWQRMKSLCVLLLLSNKMVQSFRAIREEETALMMARIEEESRSTSPGVLNLSEMFAEIANHVVCRSTIGRKYAEGESGKKFRRSLWELAGLLGNANVGDFLPWLGWINWVNGRDALAERVAKELDEFLEVVLEERMDRLGRRERKNGLVEGVKGDDDDDERREDFVDILLKIYMEDEAGDGVSIDRNSIKALMLDIIAAGTNTTYLVLEWAMTKLLRYPQTMKELQKEVRQIANGKLDITEDDLKKLPYLKAVIKETLRLHPPVPLVPREARSDVKVMGYNVTARTMVIVNAWAIGRDPAAWDAPEDFRPGRFLADDSTMIDFWGHNFKLIPFGSGRGGCPGIAFAMVINELVLANLVCKFDWKLPKGVKTEDLDTIECFGLNIHREVPILVVPNPRSF